MNTTEKPDITDAKTHYTCGGNYNFNHGVFSKYSPSYIITNEPLSWEASLVPNAKSVLTIAGSGDQALFYKLSGAEHIDTFDVSYCAHAIQDIKTTAIRNIGYNSYIKLLTQLHETSHAMRATYMLPILNKLPVDTIDFIKKMDGYFIFANGGNPKHQYLSVMLTNNQHSKHGRVITKFEYKKLQSCLPKRFNFIWSDILNLHTKLKQKYDVINTSNVFDYLLPSERNAAISNLYPFLKQNGQMLICECPTPEYDESKFKMKQYVHEKPNPASVYPSMISLQKIR